MMKLMNETIYKLHDKLVKKECTALDLVKECIEGVKADDCNCFESTRFDQALKEASEIKEVKENEILKGIPYLAKDNYSTKGMETSASSHILDGYTPLFDATVISKLKRQGMILVAHTTMDELAMGGTGTTGRKGPTLNPYDKERIIGGSSCGSAAAMVKNIAPFALGSDTGDSVRKPASNAGLVGFKPTWGRISRYGLFPFAQSLDTIAYFTKDVLDAAIILQVLAGKDSKDMSSSYRKKDKYTDFVEKKKTLKRIGYFKAVMDNISDEEIKREFEKLLLKLNAKGYEVIEYDFPIELLNALYPTYMIISCAEATSNDANLDGIRFGPKPEGEIKTYKEYMTKARTLGFSELIKKRFVVGSFSLLSANQEEMFSRAQKARRLIVNATNTFFDSIDYLISPASFSLPSKLVDLNNAWSPNPDFLDNILTIGNLGGYPSITLPFMKKDGFPIGVNITSRIFEENYCLGLASCLEEITGMANFAGKEN